jgi:transcriptional repressor NrdR
VRCPFCSNQDSQVKDSRPTEDNTAIRRRRICDQCGSRFTTFERIQLRDLIVLKTNGKKEVFDRDKMFRSLSLALRKRNVDQEKIEKIVNAIVRKLENFGDTEVKTTLIGEYIMEALSHLDQIAYVRFASVYKNFREVKDFEDFLDNLEDNPEDK